MTTLLTDSQYFLAEAPSNIALLKYWGKKDAKAQWPATSSLSMTLDSSKTRTLCRVIDQDSDVIYLNGKMTLDSKISKHLDFLRKKLNTSTKFEIRSANTFPTACGIASSASGMAALSIAVCGCIADADSMKDLEAKGYTRAYLANLSRMGSGSACRSIWGGFVSWRPGETPEEQLITQEQSATHLELSDTIIIFDDQKKKVSSSEGHKCAEAAPIFDMRVAADQERFRLFNNALDDKDLDLLGLITEEEAMQMHSMAWTGSPPINYWSAATKSFCSWLRKMRQEKNLKAWFTIDAGPNVHVLCKVSDQKYLLDLIATSPYSEYKVISDRVGNGPSLCKAIGSNMEAESP